MAAIDDAIPPPFGNNFDQRIRSLEWVVPGVSADLKTTRSDVEKLTVDAAVMRESQKAIAKDVSTLTTKLDRLTWAIVFLALTIAASAISLALTIAGGVG
jgi:hypothetical protein